VADDDEIGGWSWIGWDTAGTVERLDDEAIETRFFCVLIPVRPGKSYYRFRTRSGDEAAIEIPRHRRSVLAGLSRTPLWLGALILTLPAVVMPARWLHLLPIGLGLAVLAAAVTFGLGRLGADERERRRLLQRVTGLGAPPELLPDGRREATAEDLADAWFDRHGEDWRDAIERGVASEQLVALAEYYLEPDLAAFARESLHAVRFN
jgi:hypothetical protein